MDELVLITGLPGSGKSTLAGPLARAVSMPLLAEDNLKESLFDSLGVRDRSQAMAVGTVARAAFIRLMSDARRTVVDAFWRHRDADGDLSSLHGKHYVQVYCQCPPRLAMERYQKRAEDSRHPGHHDEEIVYDTSEIWFTEPFEPLTVPGDLIIVDSTSAIDVEIVASQVRSALSKSGTE